MNKFIMLGLGAGVLLMALTALLAFLFLIWIFRKDAWRNVAGPVNIHSGEPRKRVWVNTLEIYIDGRMRRFSNNFWLLSDDGFFHIVPIFGLSGGVSLRKSELSASINGPHYLALKSQFREGVTIIAYFYYWPRIERFFREHCPGLYSG